MFFLNKTFKLPELKTNKQKTVPLIVINILQRIVQKEKRHFEVDEINTFTFSNIN